MKCTQVVWVVASLLVLAASARADELASWRDGQAKSSIMEFVAKATTEGSPGFIPREQRIAVFDNDGTLWAEQPAYVQLLFAMDRVRALAPEHPEWSTTPPFSHAIAGDLKALGATGEQGLLELITATHSGMTTDEFREDVRRWLDVACHPQTGRPYTWMTYLPMLELLEHLRAHGFATWIVSGGGVEFMRAFAEEVYGVPPQQVIGSRIATEFGEDDSVPVIRRLPKIAFIDDGPGKPLAIDGVIGRRPIAAFGNSDGDLPMLQWTAAGAGPRLCVLVHHTDAGREWAYDRTSPIGRLDRGLDAARAADWTIVDMSRDWGRIFAE